jgi:hypothetical protein
MKKRTLVAVVAVAIPLLLGGISMAAGNGPVPLATTHDLTREPTVVSTAVRNRPLEIVITVTRMEERPVIPGAAPRLPLGSVMTIPAGTPLAVEACMAKFLEFAKRRFPTEDGKDPVVLYLRQPAIVHPTVRAESSTCPESGGTDEIPAYVRRPEW